MRLVTLTLLFAAAFGQATRPATDRSDILFQRINSSLSHAEQIMDDIHDDITEIRSLLR